MRPSFDNAKQVIALKDELKAAYDLLVANGYKCVWPASEDANASAPSSKMAMPSVAAVNTKNICDCAFDYIDSLHRRQRIFNPTLTLDKLVVDLQETARSAGNGTYKTVCDARAKLASAAAQARKDVHTGACTYAYGEPLGSMLTDGRMTAQQYDKLKAWAQKGYSLPGAQLGMVITEMDTLKAENARLLNGIRLAAAQREGCGGNLSDKEALDATLQVLATLDLR